MKGIAELLSRISQKVFSGEEKNTRVATVIKNVLGVEIGRDSVKFSGSGIYIEAEPILKNEIALRKKEILEAINKAVGSNYTNIN